MFVHRFGVHDGHDDGGGHATSGTNRTEQMSGVMAIVAYHRWPRPDRSPDIGVAAFLSHPGFVLEPDLDRFTGQSPPGQPGVLHDGNEVFLKASCAASSFFG